MAGKPKILKLVKPETEGLLWQDKTISKEDADGKVHSLVAKIPVIKDVKDAQAACSGDIVTFMSLLRGSIVRAYEANVRAQVNTLAGGIDKKLERAAKALCEASGLPKDAATISKVVEKLKAQRASLVA